MFVGAGALIHRLRNGWAVFTVVDGVRTPNSNNWASRLNRTVFRSLITHMTLYRRKHRLDPSGRFIYQQ